MSNSPNGEIYGYLINDQSWEVVAGTAVKQNHSLLCQDTGKLEVFDVAKDNHCFKVRTKKVNPTEEYVEKDDFIAISKQNVINDFLTAPRALPINQVQNIIDAVGSVTTVVSPLVETTTQSTVSPMNQYKEYGMIDGNREV